MKTKLLLILMLAMCSIMKVNATAYDVVVGTFAQSNTTKDYVHKMQRMGYTNAFYEPVRNANGGQEYRVIASREYSKANAEQVKRNLAYYGVSSWIWTRDGSNNRSSSVARELVKNGLLSEGVVSDSEGWSNIRAGASRKAKIVRKIKSGTKILFRIADVGDNGWLEAYDAKTGEFIGYIHNSVVRDLY